MRVDASDRMSRDLRRPLGIDRLRKAVGARTDLFPAVALSLGVAEGSPGCTIDDLIRRADDAMYVDKAERSGRS